MTVHLQIIEKFFNAIADDSRINSGHISLYMALFYFSMLHAHENPVSFSSTEIMRIAKISSRSTYNRSIKALHEYGYIKYIPSYNPYLGSLVYL